MVRRTLDRLVTATDVGRVIGVSPDRVRQLSLDDERFPEPVGLVGQAMVWRWEDVEAWARMSGRPLAPPSMRRWMTPRSSYARSDAQRVGSA
jgi:predicted DNA-binding transcriptional regulator AlpA